MPHAATPHAKAQCCSRCFYINNSAHQFCTNCGLPLHLGESHTLYQLRIKRRKEMLLKSLGAVHVARVFLYVAVAVLVAAGIGFLFGVLEHNFLVALLCAVGASLLLLTALWSLHKPFTALLTAFVCVLTFSTITIFGEFTQTFTSVQGIYTIIISAVLLYFLLKGVEGAYQSDLIQEEMQII